MSNQIEFLDCFRPKDLWAIVAGYLPATHANEIYKETHTPPPTLIFQPKSEDEYPVAPKTIRRLDLSGFSPKAENQSEPCSVGDMERVNTATHTYVMGLFKICPHVEEIICPSYTSNELLTGLTGRYENWTYLDLSYCVNSFDPQVVKNLLNAAPRIQTLILTQNRPAPFPFFKN